MSDVVIIGGGVIGSSIAYHLAAMGERSVTVIERDPSYSTASSALSASSIRQQFTTPTCIAMSRYGFNFLASIDEHLGLPGERADVGLVERGYLYLADATQRPGLEAAVAVQREQGVEVRAMTPDELACEMPWLKVEGVAIGALGLSREGWFDGYSLLQAFRRKARALGVRFRHDEVAGIVMEGERVAGVRLASGETLAAGVVVNAAGPRAGQVAAMAGVELPVGPERRFIFAFRCAEPPPAIPLVIDPSGLYVRPEGDLFIAGSPIPGPAGEDPFGLDVDYAQFDDVVWPTLAARIPAFEAIRMTRAWAGHYEMNHFDHNALIGWAPERTNFLLATGFSGHGMQHAAAAGRGVAELILYGEYRSLDLSALSPDRILAGRPLVELNII